MDSIINQIHPEHFGFFKEAFHKNGGSCNQQAFVQVMKDAGFSGVSASAVRDLFRAVDFNGDGTMTWDELSTFFIDVTMTNMGSKPHEVIKRYGCVSVVTKEESIAWMGFLGQKRDKLIVIDRIGRMSFLNPTTLTTQGNVIVPELRGLTIYNAEYIPTTDMYAVCGDDMQIHLITQGNLLDELYVHNHRLDSTSHMLRWNSDLERLFVGTRFGTIREYMAEHSKKDPIRKTSVVHHIHSDAIQDFMFIGYQKIVTASLDRQVKIYDVTSRESHLIGLHDNGVTKVSNCEFYRYVVSVGFDAEAYVWMSDVSRLQPTPLKDLASPHQGTMVGVHSVANSPQIITGDEHGLIKIWDARTFRCVQSMRMGETETTDTSVTIEPRHRMSRMMYHPDSNEIIGCYRKYLYVHAYDNGNDPTVANDTRITCIHYCVPVQLILTCSGTEIRLWDIIHGVVQGVLPNVSDADITAICTDSLGLRFYIGLVNGAVQGNSLRSGTLTIREELHKSDITSICYVDRARTLVTCGTDGFVTAFNEVNKSIVKMSLHEGSAVVSAALHPFGVITGSEAGNVIFFNYEQPRSIEHVTTSTNGPVNAVCAFDGLPCYAVAYANGEFCIWGTRHIRPDPFALLGSWHLARPFGGVAGDRHGSHVTTLGMTLFGAGMVRSIEDEAQKGASVTCLKFASSQHVLFAGDNSGKVTTWSLCHFFQATKFTQLQSDDETQTPPLSFVPPMMLFPQTHSWVAHSGDVSSMDLIPHAQALITTGLDNRVKLWTFEGVRIAELSQGRTKDFHPSDIVFPEIVNNNNIVSSSQRATKDVSRLARVAALTRKAAHSIQNMTLSEIGAGGVNKQSQPQRSTQPSSSIVHLLNSNNLHKGLSCVTKFKSIQSVESLEEKEEKVVAIKSPKNKLDSSSLNATVANPHTSAVYCSHVVKTVLDPLLAQFFQSVPIPMPSKLPGGVGFTFSPNSDTFGEPFSPHHNGQDDDMVLLYRDDSSSRPTSHESRRHRYLSSDTLDMTATTRNDNQYAVSKGIARAVPLAKAKLHNVTHAVLSRIADKPFVSSLPHVHPKPLPSRSPSPERIPFMPLTETSRSQEGANNNNNIISRTPRVIRSKGVVVEVPVEHGVVDLRPKKKIVTQEPSPVHHRIVMPRVPQTARGPRPKPFNDGEFDAPITRVSNTHSPCLMVTATSQQNDVVNPALLSTNGSATTFLRNAGRSLPTDVNLYRGRAPAPPKKVVRPKTVEEPESEKLRRKLFKRQVAERHAQIPLSTGETVLVPEDLSLRGAVFDHAKVALVMKSREHLLHVAIK